ncbi:MAG: hypothetical protein R3C49_20025 [Planctomycetaceae bacterium]
MKADGSSRRASPNYEDDVGQRGLPGVFQLLRPRMLAGWIWDFITAWWHSRPGRNLLLGLPFLLVVIGSTAFLAWGWNLPQAQLPDSYTAAVADAVQRGDLEAAVLYQEAIVRLRPSEDQHRLKLVTLMAELGQPDRAVSYLADLTDETGYVPARIWLLQQAASETPAFPLTEDQVLQQLRLILKQDAQNTFANRQLAEICLRRGELKEAEDRLLQIVEAQPEFRLLLATVQQQLRRPEDSVRQQFVLADQFFRDRLLQNPADEVSRLRRAECLIGLKQPSEAQQLLLEGLRQQPTETLKAALAGLYSRIAAERLNESALNRDLSLQLVLKAIQLTPGSRQLLIQALQLNAMGAPLTVDQLQPAIEEQLKSDDQDSMVRRLLLAETYAAVDQPEQAITQLEDASDSNPELRLPLARLWKTVGRNEDVTRTIDQLLKELPDSDTSRETAMKRAEILLVADQPEEAWSVLQNADADTSELTDVVRRQWQRLLHQATLALFDARLSAFDGEDATDDLKEKTEQLVLEPLLKQIESGSATVPMIDRLARLSCSDSPLSARADALLERLLARGSANAAIYNLVGTQALRAGDIQKGRKYLERAYSLEPANPMVLNNLAISLVRGAASSEQLDRARELSNTALSQLPDHPDVLSTRAEIYLAQDRLEDARRDLEISLPHRPESVNIRMLLVKVFTGLNEPSLAAQHQKVLDQLRNAPSEKSNPNSPTQAP